MGMALKAEEKELGRKRRGKISERDLNNYLTFNDDQIIALLKSEDAQERTIAANLLGKRRCHTALDDLCKVLKKEKSLYVRLAIAESLSKFGESAVAPLCNLLGEIGNNQETDLPERCCEKKSYPLVRDFAGRILAKIGSKAVPSLVKILFDGTPRQIEQAIDALGAIAYRTGDLTSLGNLLQLMEHESENPFLVWKMTRSLGGYRSMEAVQKLITVLHHYTQPAIRWEAIRSLGEIAMSDDFIFIELENAQTDPDLRVREAATHTIKRLETGYTG